MLHSKSLNHNEEVSKDCLEGLVGVVLEHRVGFVSNNLKILVNNFVFKNNIHSLKAHLAHVSSAETLDGLQRGLLEAGQQKAVGIVRRMTCNLQQLYNHLSKGPTEPGTTPDGLGKKLLDDYEDLMKEVKGMKSKDDRIKDVIKIIEELQQIARNNEMRNDGARAVFFKDSRRNRTIT